MSSLSSSELTEVRLQQEQNIKKALAYISQLAQNEEYKKIFPFILTSSRKHPEMLRIRLHTLDSVMFCVGEKKAYRTLNRARRMIHDTSPIKTGHLNIKWLFEGLDFTAITNSNMRYSDRLTTWLYLLMIREKKAYTETPDGFPYIFLYDDYLGDSNE